MRLKLERICGLNALIRESAIMSTTFAATHETNTSRINTLIQTLKDGEAGFLAAATDVVNPDLKSTFHHYAIQRRKFATELQMLVVREGEAPESSGSLSGAAHRGWMSVRSVVSAHEDSAILEECERGEDSAVVAFKDALSDVKLGAAKSIVDTQFTEIRKAHDHIRKLRDQHRA